MGARQWCRQSRAGRQSSVLRRRIAFFRVGGGNGGPDSGQLAIAGGSFPQREIRSGCHHQGALQHRAQKTHPLARSVARFLARAEGAPRIRLKKGRNGIRLRQLTGRMSLSPANCLKAVMACDQSVATCCSELWWEGDQVHGTIERAGDLQMLVTQEARTTPGVFRTTNQGRLSLESGIGVT